LNRVLALARQAARARSGAASRAEHDYHTVYRALKARLQELFGPALPSVRVLDFGCGFTYPLLILLQKDVKEIVGVDVGPSFRDGLPSAIAAGGGLRKPGGAAAAVLEYAQAKHYYRHLQQQAAIPVRHADYRIVRYDGSRLPFDEGAFDCVISNAVLQELPLPLEPFAGEMARVLKPGGAIDLEWHNFYSWSGHYKGEQESRRMPWGHLRGGPYHPCLNRATPTAITGAYSPAFAHLRVLGHDHQYRLRDRDPRYVPEGKDSLTPEIAAQLAEYPREWLLTRGYILQGYRR